MRSMPVAWGLKRHVVWLLGRWSLRFRGLVGGWHPGRRSRPSPRGFGGGSAIGPRTTADEFEAFQNYSELTALLAGLLIVPLIQSQPTFHEEWAALLQILGDGLRLLAERINVHERDLLFGFSGLGAPGAIDCQTEFGNRHAFWRVSQFGVAG